MRTNNEKTNQTLKFIQWSHNENLNGKENQLRKAANLSQTISQIGQNLNNRHQSKLNVRFTIILLINCL